MFFWTPQQAASTLSAVYNRIADEFDSTRESVWKELRILFEKTPLRAKILDLGCGNGRLTALFEQKNCTITGVDPSEALLQIAQKKHPKATFRKGNFLNIPAPNNRFDEVWCVASFHHLPTQHSRLKALQEIHRVLRQKGECILVVWNIWDQTQYRALRWRAFWRSVFLPWWSKRDFLIPWGKEKIPRYYHSFIPEDLIKLARKNGFILVEYWGTHDGEKGPIKNSRNICFRLQKA